MDNITETDPKTSYLSDHTYTQSINPSQGLDYEPSQRLATDGQQSQSLFVTKQYICQEDGNDDQEIRIHSPNTTPDSSQDPQLDLDDIESMPSPEVPQLLPLIDNVDHQSVDYWCGECHQTVTINKDVWIRCQSHCRQYYHIECSGVKRSLLNVINMSNNILWRCHYCVAIDPQIRPLVQFI